MDIQSWLQEAATTPDPTTKEDLGFPAFFRAKSDAGRDAQRYHRKRKHHSSDSSIIAPRPHHAYHERRRSRRDEPIAADHVRRRTRSASSALGPSDAASSSEHGPSETFEKRPRRKTRPDRYEPKSKSRKEDHAGKSRKKQRKSRNTDDGGRTSGLVQRFQLKGGPVNNRLTLKHSAPAGLFKHGRASTAATGRGLPDLVFNEMNFLRAPQEHQDDPPEKATSKRPSRKDQQDQEISAYFGTKKPKTVHIKQIPQVSSNARRRVSLQPPISDHRDQLETKGEPVKPTIELPGRPFLGFGSKGRRAPSPLAEEKTTTYFSWSESTQGLPYADRRGPIQLSAIEVSQRGPCAVAKRATHDDTARAPRRRPPRYDSGKRCKSSLDGLDGRPNDAWVQTHRTTGTGLVMMYKPAIPQEKHPSQARRSTTKTTVQSLPAMNSQRSDSLSGYNNPRASSYHTSDILRIQVPNQPSGMFMPSNAPHERSEAQSQENIIPATTSPTSKLLRKAKAAVEDQALPIGRLSGQAMDNTVGRDEEVMRSPWVRDAAKISSPPRFVVPEHVVGDNMPQIEDNLFQQAARLSEEMQTYSSNRQTRPLPTVSAESRSRWPLPAHSEPQYSQSLDDEMLDNAPDAPPLLTSRLNHETPYRFDADAVYAMSSVQRPSIYESQMAQEPPMSEPVVRSEGQITLLPSQLFEYPAETPVPSPSRPAVSETGFVGFWKPYRQY